MNFTATLVGTRRGAQALWLVAAMLIALALIAVFPQLALWLPRTLGY